MDDIGSSILKQMDVSWIVLIIVGIVIFISSIITICVLCLLWRRHRKRPPVINKPHGTVQIPVQINNRPSHSYETQKMEIFVPQDDEGTTQRNLGEIHARFTPEDGIQEMHQFYQRTNKAYF